jgi:alpha-L-rhamnosidase
MGATTIWERFDSMLPDGSINPGEMTSFNHYALGAVADWMHRRVAGLAPGSAGYRSIVIDPLPASQLTRAAARHLTPYGEVRVAWERSGGSFRLTATVPVGSTATVHLPGSAEPVEVRHGDHEWTVDDPYAEAVALPADATIRQLLDHESSWDAIVEAAVSAGIVADDAQLARRLERYLDAPATTLIDVAGARRSTGADALRARLDSLLAPQ